MRFRLYAYTNKIGSKVETIIDVEDDEWENMDGEQREAFMLRMFWDSGLVEWGYEPIN